MIGAELMARAIERQGVGTVFGLPGHLESFFGALQAREIRLIHMRHEAAVVTAADGYARMRRGIGVPCVTAGPGLANATGRPGPQRMKPALRCWSSRAATLSASWTPARSRRWTIRAW